MDYIKRVKYLISFKTSTCLNLGKKYSSWIRLQIRFVFWFLSQCTIRLSDWPKKNIPFPTVLIIFMKRKGKYRKRLTSCLAHLWGPFSGSQRAPDPDELLALPQCSLLLILAGPTQLNKLNVTCRKTSGYTGGRGWSDGMVCSNMIGRVNGFNNVGEVNEQLTDYLTYCHYQCWMM